ncbi:MAG: PIG-L family deacetylase [Kiritimatiellae bacterium]|nr:PIG-L family deacetylase [Kiritimatiellia bacterium]
MKFLPCLSALLLAAMAASGAARENIVLVEAHPDDLPGHMGTALLLAQKFNVHVVDFTHGERGLGEAGYRDGSTAKLRTAEETAVCGEAGFTLHWLDEIDGDSFASRETCNKLAELLKTLKPRAVFCHWPVDTHPDHVMSAATAMKAVRLAKISPEIYFHEQDRQSRSFTPAYYVEIAPVVARKAELVAKYVCQQGAAIAKRKDESNIVYGRNSGLNKAEVFQCFRGTVKPGHGVLDTLDVR